MFAQNQSDRKSDPSVAGARKRRSSTSAGLVLGLLVTVVFYVVVPWMVRPSVAWSEFVRRYFCGHPLEYITSGLFFIGMGILWTKLRLLPREKRALASIEDQAEQERWAESENPRRVLEHLRMWLHNSTTAPGVSQTLLARRLEDVRQYAGSQKGEGRTETGIEDHLRYLADLASDRLLQSYSLIRTITWAIPIMGFLGTVVGITMAIANVTPEQLETSLPEVTAGLAVAFDTTAQALGMSMILVFGTFLVERGEQSILNDVEQFGIRSLVPALATVATPQTSGGIPALTEWTAHMLAQQTEFWNSHLSSLQSGWADTLARQTASLAMALGQETEQTLQLHREGVTSARDQYAAVLHQNTQAMTNQLQGTLSVFTQKVEAWQNALQTTTQSAAGQTEELHRLGRTLLQMTESEQRLIQLQDELNRNLQSLQIVETLEQTVNSLNAAVSLLTAKTTLRAAA